MTKPALAVEALNLWYGSFHALRGVDIELEPGRFLALLGPSGCGKTSLLRSVAGFVFPQEGAIRIDGQDVLNLKPRERNLGMVFQQYALFPHMTAAENVAFGLKCRNVAKHESDRRVKEALDLVGLAEFIERKPRHLSGGQQQRVALARALVIEPNILLLDEPLGALDKKLRTQMQTELQVIQRRLGVTSVFVTHDQEEAMAMADTIAIMRDGEIEQIGPPQEIFDAPRTRWAADFVGAGNVIDGVLEPEAGSDALRMKGVPGCAFSLRDGTPGEGSLYVPANRLDFTPANGAEGLEVASHRYLGVHVEVTAQRGEQKLRSLVSPAEAQETPIGMSVIATAAPENCRSIARN